MRKSVSLVFFILVVVNSAWATLRLPRNLNQSEREMALQVLGFGGASKILSNPYPLGGYSGFELGLSNEYIPLQDLAGLGSKSSDKGEYNCYVLSMAKGFYYNFDTVFYFTPLAQEDGATTFGGQLRWGIYDFKFFPATISAIFHMGGANYNSVIATTNTGSDLVASVNVSNVALYFGVGQFRSIGNFTGGASGVTSSGNNESADVTQSHNVFGLNISVDKVFMAFEVDRFFQSTYSMKAGVRF